MMHEEKRREREDSLERSREPAFKAAAKNRYREPTTTKNNVPLVVVIVVVHVVLSHHHHRTALSFDVFVKVAGS